MLHKMFNDLTSSRKNNWTLELQKEECAVFRQQPNQKSALRILIIFFWLEGEYCWVFNSPRGSELDSNCVILKVKYHKSPVILFLLANAYLLFDLEGKEVAFMRYFRECWQRSKLLKWTYIILFCVWAVGVWKQLL